MVSLHVLAMRGYRCVFWLCTGVAACVTSMPDVGIDLSSDVSLEAHQSTTAVVDEAAHTAIRPKARSNVHHLQKHDMASQCEHQQTAQSRYVGTVSGPCRSVMRSVLRFGMQWPGAAAQRRARLCAEMFSISVSVHSQCSRSTHEPAPASAANKAVHAILVVASRSAALLCSVAVRRHGNDLQRYWGTRPRGVRNCAPCRRTVADAALATPAIDRGTCTSSMMPHQIIDRQHHRPARCEDVHTSGGQCGTYIARSVSAPTCSRVGEPRRPCS